MIPLDQQYQLFASAGAIKFPTPEKEAWKEKVFHLEGFKIWGEKVNLKFTMKIQISICPVLLTLFQYFFLKQIKRLYLLLTVKESAMDVPSNLEARRRISFFSNSLFMDMPVAPKVRNMLSFS